MDTPPAIALSTSEITRCTLDELICELRALREAALEHAESVVAQGPDIRPEHRGSAENLAHFVAIRSFDLRPLQERLSALGLSSLGRFETDVLASVEQVLSVLEHLAAPAAMIHEPLMAVRFAHTRAHLEANANALFGAVPWERGVRIMVTLPSEAATDDALIPELVRAGMDVARINCAHDDAAGWRTMAERVRAAAKAQGHDVRVHMDLGGPKLRTGPVDATRAIVRIKPVRDDDGAVLAPARLGLYPAHAAAGASPVDAWAGADAKWLGALRPDDAVEFDDAWGRKRRGTVTGRAGEAVVLALDQTVRLRVGLVLHHVRGGERLGQCALAVLPGAEGRFIVAKGELLRVTASGPGRGAQEGAEGDAALAQVACTLPEALPFVRVGEAVWFDDGRIGGEVTQAGDDAITLRITHCLEGGDRIRADKGINLPDTALELPALTEKDLEDLAAVSELADTVALSFAQSADDVRQLQRALRARGAEHIGIVLKIETRRAFDKLPQMLLAGLEWPHLGVMIARGDLAVECGFERMAEVQEEILWACEAAHVPAIWATQVLDTQARTGIPSRAEVTDAAMSVRAECVMLNKGPHIVDAIRTLDDILRRMRAHQAKKRPMMRALKTWAVDTAEPEHAPPRG